MRELKRRGLETNQVSAADEGAPSGAEAAKPLTPPQLAKSRALAYEGLEGLLPRAKELVKLGGSFFLGFGPLILLLLVLSAGTYAVRVCPHMEQDAERACRAVRVLTRSVACQVWGNSFIHGGRSSYTPPVVDPYELLAQPSARDPMVPLQ